MSFLSKFSRKKLERRASIATITEIPERNSGWKSKVGFDLHFFRFGPGISGPLKSEIPRRNHDKPGHARLSRRISERLDGRTSVKISDNYEIDEIDFMANESGKSF